MQRWKPLYLMLLALLVLGLPAAADTELEKSVVSAGGDRSNNGTHWLVCTVGQPCVGTMTSGGYRHIVGFLAPGVIVSSAVDDLESLPTEARLAQNSPNPFNPATTIRFDLPDSRRVRLEVFSLDGRRVARLIDKTMAPGRLAVHWDGRDEYGRALASGTYLYRLTAGDFRATNRMVLMR